jgi:steroid delta-isomerase-like uncharacterized protein
VGIEVALQSQDTDFGSRIQQSALSIQLIHANQPPWNFEACSTGFGRWSSGIAVGQEAHVVLLWFDSNGWVRLSGGASNSQSCFGRKVKDDGTRGTICDWQACDFMDAAEVDVASATIPADGGDQDRRSARIAVVEQHIRLENEHDLEGILRTFGDAARYDDEAWDEHYEGGNGVRQFYEQLMTALPDLEIEVRRWHITDDAVLVEVMIRGTHLGAWRGLAGTGRRVEVPLCGVYTFDSDDRLAGEKIYYDRGKVLRQLGVFHEPQTVLGQLSILATHPLTITRAFARKLLRR